MDTTKKIIFQAEDSGVKETYQNIKSAGEAAGKSINQTLDQQIDRLTQLKSDTEDLGRMMIKEAREYTTSGKEVINYLNEQIQAIERRNKLEKSVGSYQAEKFYQTKMSVATTEGERKSAKEEYSGKISGLTEKSREDDLQLELLRELIETVKKSSKDEIIEDRKSVEKNIEGSDRVKGLGIDQYDDELEALKESLQYQAIGDLKGSEKEQSLKFAGKSVSGTVNQVAGLSTLPNEFYMLAAVTAAIPIIGHGVSQVMSKLLGSAEGYEKGLGAMTSVGGGDFGQYKGMGANAHTMGVNTGDFLKRGSGIAVARGGIRGFERATMESIALEQGMNIGQGDILNNERLMRGGGSSSTNTIQQLYKGLHASGAMKGGDMSLMNEYFQISNSVGQDQLQILGRIDTGINTKLITQLTQNNLFSNPEVLKNIVQGLQSGLTSAKTPQIEALQLSTLSRLNPGANLFELEKMMEGGMQTKGYLSGMLGTLKKTSFGKNEFYRNISNTFGLSKTMSEQLGLEFEGGKIDEQAWSSKMNEQKGISSGGIRKRAESSTGLLEASTAKLDNTFAITGEKMVVGMDNLVNKIQDWIDKVQDYLAGDYIYKRDKSGDEGRFVGGDLAQSTQMIEFQKQNAASLKAIEEALKSNNLNPYPEKAPDNLMDLVNGPQ